jgi:GNAT superfamily N-acetyltransferase
VIRELLPPETGLAHRAMLALREEIGDREAFTQQVDDVQRPEGYRLLGAFEDGVAEALGVAGFRIVHNLAWGEHVYIDDLSTLPEARGRGHATALLNWVFEEGRRSGVKQLHLDSAVGPARADAHRLYLNSGYTIASHHFGRPIDE